MAVRRKRNLFPAVFLALLCWGIVAFFLFFVDPEVVRNFPISNSYLPFFLFLFFAVFFTASLIFSHSRRGFLLAVGLIVFLYLRLFELGHFLNAILIFFLLIVLELAVSTQK